MVLNLQKLYCRFAHGACVYLNNVHKTKHGTISYLITEYFCQNNSQCIYAYVTWSMLLIHNRNKAKQLYIEITLNSFFFKLYSTQSYLNIVGLKS